MFNKVLVITCHPDDETLGAGGTIKKWIKNGSEVHWLVATSMIESNNYTYEQVETRDKEIVSIKQMYEFKSYDNLMLEPAGLHKYDLQELINKLHVVINRIKPDTVIINHFDDEHSDHRILFDAFRPFTKSFRFPFIKRILLTEILSETMTYTSTFKPNYYVDISEYMNFKLDAIKLYKSEVQAHPMPRSIENIRAQAMLRGADVHLEFAEAFQVYKWID